MVDFDSKIKSLDTIFYELDSIADRLPAIRSYLFNHRNEIAEVDFRSVLRIGKLFDDATSNIYDASIAVELLTEELTYLKQHVQGTLI